MTRRARRTRALFRLRAAALLALCGCALAAAIAACGLDSIGSHTLPTPEVDATPTPEASLPPDNDAELPDGAGDAQQGRCRTDLPGPPLVYVPSEAGTGPFCIDSTEVTSDQYEVFLAGIGDGGMDAALDGAAGEAGAPVECEPNKDFQRKADAGIGDVPITNVTWCDAFAYCRWAGKHLCGGDLDGGQWIRACTHDAIREYPYADAEVPDACYVNQTAPAAALAPAGSYAGCEGAYAGVFGMVGNAAEYADTCVGNVCYALGGGYLFSVTPNPSCYAVPVAASPPSGGYSASYGFRCCAGVP